MPRTGRLATLAGMRVVTDLSPFPEQAYGSVLVPTMGALHEGHLSLIGEASRAARERGIASGCCVTVFVNPTQFDDPADFERYARVLDEDIEACEAAGAETVFAPSPEAVYPPHEKIMTPRLPDQAIEKGLEDAQRPGHFEGVCQVVRRLFDLTHAGAAVFGEKDWQQYAVIRAMAARDTAHIGIIPSPTVREPDGLAMSSRNRFLPPHLREQALSLSRALIAARRETTPDAAEAAMRAVYSDHGIVPDYAAVRDAETLGPYRPGHAGRVITAAPIQADPTPVRLLDNAPWPG